MSAADVARRSPRRATAAGPVLLGSLPGSVAFRAKDRAGSAAGGDLEAAAAQLTAALAAASRAGAALVDLLAAARPQLLEDLRDEVELARAERDTALAAADTAAEQSQALRDALASERELRRVLQNRAGASSPAAGA